MIGSPLILQFKEAHDLIRIRNAVEILPVMPGIEMKKTICQRCYSLKLPVSPGSDDHRSVKIPAVIVFCQLCMNAPE